MITIMKKTIIKSFILGATLLTGFTACDDYLDVSPKSQIEADDMFSREGGYKDQLTGVYSVLCSDTLYGCNMSIGFAEVLSQNYDIDANSTLWYYPSLYDYTNSSVETTIENIWLCMYNCIANLNVMLEYIEKADPSIFSDNNYYVYRGEALGLRAFLHLDLMRLFACSPAMDKNANGVPYVTEYTTQVVQQKTVSETMDLIIDDLLEAKEYLEHDSLKISYQPYYQRDRCYYFNYFAAVATLARAYLWNGDTQNALTYANEIIDVQEDYYYSSPFTWIHYTNLQQSDRYLKDVAFTTEHIFHLTINDWDDITDLYFKEEADESTVNKLRPSETKINDIFEYNKGYANDYRYLHGFEYNQGNLYPSKFWYVENSSYNNIYPMIRMTEAYYIAAECLKNSDPVQAVELLNTVRENRNLSLYPLDDDLSADEIQEEIYKEYRKEFIAEGGQLFFYYKRLNASTITGASVTPNKSIYVLPIPETDAEYGGYSN